MGKWMVQFMVPIVAALALLFGVIALSRGARAALHDRPKYTLAFHDIACTPPYGMSRRDFLAEVRSTFPLPDRLHLLERKLADRLAHAFAVHPRVESVREIRIRPALSANGHVRPALAVELIYREAVVIVKRSSDASPASSWIVDRNGIRLPDSAREPHLPILIADTGFPAGPPGTHCGDRRIVAAAATAAFLKPYLARLRLEDCEIDIIDNRLILRKADVRIVWGNAPGWEGPGEAPAAVKRQRLLDYQDAHEGLEGLEHDVRLLSHQGHFPLVSELRP